jgi:hypothetical protein
MDGAADLAVQKPPQRRENHWNAIIPRLQSGKI